MDYKSLAGSRRPGHGLKRTDIGDPLQRKSREFSSSQESRYDAIQGMTASEQQGARVSERDNQAPGGGGGGASSSGGGGGGGASSIGGGGGPPAPG